MQSIDESTNKRKDNGNNRILIHAVYCSMYVRE